MTSNQFFNKLLRELSYRSTEGYHILAKKEHQDLISDILSEWVLGSMKSELIQNLNEGGEEDAQGQSGGAATAGAGVGGTARGGGGRGVQTDPARVVSGGGSVSEGVAGANGRAAGSGALRRGADGDGGSVGGGA